MSRHEFRLLLLLPPLFLLLQLLLLLLPPLLEMLAMIFAVNSASCKTLPYATSAMGAHMLTHKLQVARGCGDDPPQASSIIDKLPINHPRRLLCDTTG